MQNRECSFRVPHHPLCGPTFIKIEILHNMYANNELMSGKKKKHQQQQNTSMLQSKTVLILNKGKKTKKKKKVNDPIKFCSLLCYC